MSDRCHTHKARACQKCAGDAGGLTRTSALFVRHDDRCESEYDPSAHAWTPCGCWASRAEAEGLVAEVERLAGVVAKVRELHQDGGGSQGFFPGDRGYGVRDHCCTECGSFGEYGVEWPCWTVRTLDQADPS